MSIERHQHSVVSVVVTALLYFAITYLLGRSTSIGGIGFISASCFAIGAVSAMWERRPARAYAPALVGCFVGASIAMWQLFSAPTTHSYEPMEPLWRYLIVPDPLRVGAAFLLGTIGWAGWWAYVMGGRLLRKDSTITLP